jgi:hypothetical protein
MNKRQESIWFICTAVLAVAVTIYLLSYIVTSPGHMMIALGGDAGMTYHAYLYHILYEKGAWTNCMNYPYGDNVTYKGSLPLLSIPLSYLRDILHINSDRALAVMHLAIGLSYVLAILYTYKILRIFNVRPLLCMLFSCLIILLSPQVFRLLGHFGLTYTCVIPMLFYWSLRYYHSPHWRYPLYISLLGILMSFSHLYFGGIIFVWVVFYVIGYFIFVRQRFAATAKHTGVLVLGALCMFVVLKSFLLLTDPIEERPTFQSNAVNNITYKTHLLTSPHSPIWQAIKGSWKDVEISNDNDEGYAYLGIVTILVFIISVITGLVLLIKKRDRLVAENRFAPIWLFIGFCSLFLAMDIPYRLNMNWLFDYTYVFKQFRSLGRFSWIFYYVIAIYSVVVINSWYEKVIGKRRYFIACTLLVVAVGVWGAEAKGYADFIRSRDTQGAGYYRFFFSKDEQAWIPFLKEHNRSKDEFQAILSLTFANMGTEKISIGNDESSWVMTIAGKAAIQLHLPIIDAFIARESWSQAESQVRIIGGLFADKPILKLVDKRPFLLLHFDEDSLDHDSKYLFAASDYIGHYSQFYIYACYPERIAANDKKAVDSVFAVVPFMHNNDTCIGSTATWYFNHFDTGTGQERLFGAGAAARIPGYDRVVADIHLSPASDTQLYEFSCWFLLSKNDPYYPSIYIESTDSAGNIFNSKELIAKSSVDNHGLWFRTSAYFKILPECRSIRCRVQNHPNPSYIAMDELLLRPADALIISKDREGHVMVNNHLIKKEN